MELESIIPAVDGLKRALLFFFPWVGAGGRWEWRTDLYLENI